MSFVNGILDKIGDGIAHILSRETSGYEPFTPSDPETLERVLMPGDVLLVEGNQKVSSAIKYLTQSTWSHAALYVGDAVGERDENGKRLTLIEVNLGEGCVAAPLDKYQRFNTRICRPVGLTRKDRQKVVDFMVGSIGLKYDMRNIIDLMRYLLPTPPVPMRWRRRMIALGSGEPSRAICSTLIAQAFQSVKYPMLPRVERVRSKEKQLGIGTYTRREILHIRHHSLFAPRDFDLSPYFRIIKPTIENGFDYKQLEWGTLSYEEDEQSNADPAAGDDKPVVDKKKKIVSKGAEPDANALHAKSGKVGKTGVKKKDKTQNNDRTLAVNNSVYALSRTSLDKFARVGHQAFWQNHIHAGLFGNLAGHVRLAVYRLLGRRT